ncbi:hypothetical protein HAINFHK1212_1195, partial [Haemophilus influenzae HK1212]
MKFKVALVACTVCASSWEITDNTADTLSYSQLAGMIAVFTAALDCQVSTVRQLVKD